MTIKIPKQLKREFKKGFDEYIKVMSEEHTVIAVLEDTEVNCPNCLWDGVREKSTNQYDINFKTPVNVFPGTTSEKTVFPTPFNVTSVSGVQYDPSILDPQILMSAVCPVCTGNGKLIIKNTLCIDAVVTLNSGAVVDRAPGLDGDLMTRLKTYSCNYAICRDAKYFIIDGVKRDISVPAKLKGLGNKSICEVYLSQVPIDHSIDTSYDDDDRLKNVELGDSSDQASPGTPTIPPIVPGDDVW